MAVESFERHVLKACKFSGDEMVELRNMIAKLTTTSPDYIDKMKDAMTNDPKFKASGNRKVISFFSKLGVVFTSE
jgi:hypothetical protein